MNKKEQLQKELDELKAKQAKILEELEDCDKIKMGDYVVYLDNYGLIKNNVYVVDKITAPSRGDFRIHIEGYEEGGNGYYQSRFRKATNEEICAHLLKEAAEKGFVVGAKIKENKSVYSIEKLDVWLPGMEETSDCSWAVKEAIKVQKPFVWATYDDNNRSCPIEEMEIYNEIEVNGYKAEFYSGYVKFGCAMISNEQIKKAHELLKWNVLIKQSTSYSNRQIESIKIGAGVFNFETLEKIVAQLR